MSAGLGSACSATLFVFAITDCCRSEGEDVGVVTSDEADDARVEAKDAGGGARGRRGIMRCEDEGGEGSEGKHGLKVSCSCSRCTLLLE